MKHPKVTLSFSGGLDGIRASAIKRRRRLLFDAADALPPLDVDLDALAARKLPPPTPLPEAHSNMARKRHEIHSELVGHSELALLNGLLIANLRKNSWPEQAPALFLRLWREKPAALIAELPGRWLISSVITFADHGPTEADRGIGRSLNVLFSLMKLYETERQFSATRADEPYRIRNRVKSPLPIGMREMGIVDGDLITHLIAPMVTEAEAAPIAGPLALHLLEKLNQDPNNVFRRIEHMRAKKKAFRQKRGAPDAGDGGEP